MNQGPEQWTAVDEYLSEHLIGSDPALDATLEASRTAGLPAIQVTPCQGKFLHLLARIQGARKILELGTLGAYSTIWLARALPSDGRLITLEVSLENAEVANRNITRANLSSFSMSYQLCSVGCQSFQRCHCAGRSSRSVVPLIPYSR